MSKQNSETTVEQVTWIVRHHSANRCPRNGNYPESFPLTDGRTLVVTEAEEETVFDYPSNASYLLEHRITPLAQTLLDKGTPFSVCSTIGKSVFAFTFVIE